MESQEKEVTVSHIQETETTLGLRPAGVSPDRGVAGHSLEEFGHRDHGHGVQEIDQRYPGI